MSEADTCRNIVLFKPINSMTDFKQIIGRGTRVLKEQGKFWFTIIDYVGATRLFYDPAFDGDPEIQLRQKVDATGQVIDLDHLARLTHHADADPLDLLLNVAYNAPLVSRRERAARLRQTKPNFFNTFTPAARAVLDQLLDKYADFGLKELGDLRVVLHVPPFDRYGTVTEIAALFGGPVQLKSAVEQMETLLYQG